MLLFPLQELKMIPEKRILCSNAGSINCIIKYNVVTWIFSSRITHMKPPPKPLFCARQKKPCPDREKIVHINLKVHFTSYSNMKSDFQNLQQLCWILAFCVKVQKPYFCPFWALIALNLENKNFPRYGIFTESQPTIRRFILGHFQQKLMSQFQENCVTDARM